MHYHNSVKPIIALQFSTQIIGKIGLRNLFSLNVAYNRGIEYLLRPAG